MKFPLDKPMPMKLVTKVIKLQLAQNLKMTKSKSKLTGDFRNEKDNPVLMVR